MRARLRPSARLGISQVPKKPRELLVSLILLAGLLAGVTNSEAQRPAYPAARMDDVVDDYHGTRVADPYRWLEDPDSPETQAWVEEENRLTSGYIASIPATEKIRSRLTELWNYPRYSLPEREGDWYFFSKNDGLQNQSVLYKQSSLDAQPSVLLDPNTLSEDGTVALRLQAYTEDGRLLAYGLSTSGSDWQEIHVRDVETGGDLDDLIRWCKFTGVAWRRDDRGFYYNRFPEPTSAPEQARLRDNRVYWHTLGTPQSEDVLVYERPGADDVMFYPSVTEDGRYLLLHVHRGTDPRNGIYYREMADEGPFVHLMDEEEAAYDFIDNVGPVFYFRTDLDAPRSRIIAVDTRDPDRKNWREVVPEQDVVLTTVAMVNDQLAAVTMRDAHDQLNLYDLDGRHLREIELPALGTVAGISGKRGDREMFVGFTSFLYPFSSFRYDFISSTLSLFRGSEVKFDPTLYETKQVFATSKDGTRVPIFLTYRKGLRLDGNRPVLLYGYGGFNINMQPHFSSSRVVWLENGGVYGLVVLRGGSEYGEEWHQAGMLEKKQNVFDDMIAASEWMIENHYTRPSKLAIEGGSNGGLLVAACMLQRPELFGAVICEVPVTDMLRYQKFTVGHFWVPEYGNAEADPAQFKFLYAYSPLHNVKKGVAYPATLITTADTDDRVVPMHGKKFAAALQAADAGENPILLRVETKAGHGGGKPTAKRIEEATDTYAFLFRALGMTVSGTR